MFPVHDHDASTRISCYPANGHVPGCICNDVAPVVVVKYVHPARGRLRRSGTAVTYAALAPVIEGTMGTESCAFFFLVEQTSNPAGCGMSHLSFVLC